VFSHADDTHFACILHNPNQRSSAILPEHSILAQDPGLTTKTFIDNTGVVHVNKRDFIIQLL